ncbi:MAG: hypothetical protein NTY51_07625, partial [Deltaproteobacteria bacterium]|nr:hypothetical protein [Deltaproteobacteria bacterium]
MKFRIGLFYGGIRSPLRSILICGFVLLTFLFSSVPSLAQGVNPVYRQSQSVVPVDLAPSKPHSLPGTSGPQFGGGSDTIPFSSEWVRDWLPTIPNLRFGFNYLFGKNLRQSWWSADYVLPVSLTRNDIVFGEAHADSASSSSTGGFP